MRKLLVLALLGLVGCGGGASQEETTPSPDSTPTAAPPSAAEMDSVSRMSDITVTTDTRTYRAGDPVELRIVNKTATRFTYNPCTRALERQDDGDSEKWEPVKEERMCTMIAHVLEPNATRVEKTELGEGLPAGSYRMLVAFSADAPPPAAQRVTIYAYFKVISTR